MRRIRLALVLAASLPNCGARAVPPDFVRLSEVAPDIKQDIRYAGIDNFTGRPVPGYEAPVCWLKTEAAQALAKVAATAATEKLRLIVWDCYRPQRAMNAFMVWSADEKDQEMKSKYYPRSPKKELFMRGYIARKSIHSTGYAVDIGLINADGTPVDFGSGFDLFDTRSVTSSSEVSAAARTNRARLASLMYQKGFRNYPREWWHYALPDMPEKRYDEPIEP
jgi:D-alanyl-D-alanine dipeptidase